MIKVHIIPSAWVMAGTTIRAKLSIVVVIVCMTGITIRRRAFVNTIDMARAALDIGVSSRKREAGIVVIEGYIAPTTGGMTCSAVRTELSIVVVLVCVACITI